ncbi:hypothetical protein B0H14DRAFT_2574715 [Mycena olivaceomarginata]|nr:hypothetical protein B0H14DRAFT_2574715 [Mycena olivaceomarginata]
MSSPIYQQDHPCTDPWPSLRKDVRRKADATHNRAQAAPEDAVRTRTIPDGDELTDVFARTALSTPEAQWQSKSASGDSDAVSEEMPENCAMQEGMALDNRDESSSVRHVGGQEPRLRVTIGVHSVHQGHNSEDSESDSENGSWDWY